MVDKIMKEQIQITKMQLNYLLEYGNVTLNNGKELWVSK